MSRRISLRLVGAILAPAVLVAFVVGLIAAGVLNFAPHRAEAAPETSLPVSGPGGSPGQDDPFVRVADAVIPTVVNVSAEKTVTTGSRSLPGMHSLEEMFRQYFGEGPGLPHGQQRQSLGSGVVIDPDGYIVTNNHVVADFDEITVKLSDGTEFKGKDVEVVGRDPKTDLAVIKVNADRPLSAIEFGDADRIRVGSWAIAVGNPFGLQSTVTVGVVSAKGRSGIPLPEGPSYQDFIQTDASINPGNSGGALVDSRGKLIGINSAIRSPVGANVGIGFAVPVDMVKSVTRQLIEHGRVIRGFLGIRPQAVTESMRKALGLDDANGVLVGEALPDMPARKAGIRDGDVIIRIDDKPIKDLEQFRRDVADFRPNTTIRVTVFRDGKHLTKKVKLTEFPEDKQVSAAEPAEPENWLGLAVSRGDPDGVVVVGVEPGSLADDAGIRRGDRVIRIEDRKIEGMGDYNRAARELAGQSRPLLFRLKRGSSKLYVAVEPVE